VERHVAREFRFALLIEQMPLPENRITPAFAKVDALGIPRPQIDYRLGEFVERGMAEARRVADQIFDAVGVSEREHAPEHYGAGHIMGTHRMGSDPKTAVTNWEQRCHDHPNLFLLGSGSFPTVGTANPTLTIAALALWAAATMQGDLAGGGA
jgi:choline dehydrogenase-like flavoprotein